MHNWQPGLKLRYSFIFFQAHCARYPGFWLLTSCLSSFSKVLTHGLILVESALRDGCPPLLILVGLKVLETVPLTALQLRRSVVGYLRPLSACFGARMENQFRGRYGSYCSHMEQPGAWGDDLTLLASAHCLRRPLKIVTDSSATDPKQYIRIITPPQCISSACCGPEVTLCVSMDRHFDATENL